MGMAEGLLILMLAAIAPTFINSSLPIIGFLIWGAIFCLIGGSISYVLWRVWDAYSARTLFIKAFPTYRSLGLVYFLEYSCHRVQKTIHHWHIIHAEPEFQSLKMSPLEFLSGYKNHDQAP